MRVAVAPPWRTSPLKVPPGLPHLVGAGLDAGSRGPSAGWFLGVGRITPHAQCVAVDAHCITDTAIIVNANSNVLQWRSFASSSHLKT